MAATEIANQTHASASLFLGTSTALSVIRVNNGFVDGSLVRQGPGAFTIGLVEKLSPLGGQAFVTVASDTARFVSARLEPDIPGSPNENVLITCYDNTGTPADIGEVYLKVERYPNNL